MFDLGLTELLVIAVIAIVVVGPHELPGLMRTVGRWVGQARAVARDMQRAIEDAADEADKEIGVEQLKNPVQNSILAENTGDNDQPKQDADK